MRKYTLWLLLLITGFVSNDVKVEYRTIEWGPIKTFDGLNGKTEALYFENCDYHDGNYLPYYFEAFPVDENQSLQVAVISPVYSEVKVLPAGFDLSSVPDSLQWTANVVSASRERYLQVQLLPLKMSGGKLYRLESFGLKFAPVSLTKSASVQNAWAEESVLKSGRWIKIRTSQKGIYKITYDKLQAWGFTTPQNVKVYGSDGFTLSEEPGTKDHDDLQQMSVWYGKDGSGKDCLYFYSTGTTRWSYDSSGKRFKHATNPYSSYCYYFLTENTSAANSVAQYPATSSGKTVSTSSFNYYSLYELELNNLISSGKQWFGQKFVSGVSTSVNFNTEDKESGANLKFYILGAARSTASSSFSVTIDGTLRQSLSFSLVKTDSETTLYADDDLKIYEINSNNESMAVKLQYNASESNAMAWLDYIELNYRKKLIYESPETYFRDASVVGTNSVAEFTVQNAGTGLKVYDVTNPNGICEVPFTFSGSNLIFTRPATDIREYVVFNPSGSFSEPEKVGEVENQDLHAMEVPEMVIISASEFLTVSEELAGFHRANDNMSVTVVESSKIYNEFGTGMADPSSIRNFLKSMYDRSNTLKYVLLYGDGSYDNRNILGTGKNFLPTYQSDESLYPTSSFITDDYFVLLDEGETVYSGAIDLGIGRIPASSLYEAQIVLNKIQNYYKPEALGTWRNVICFIADDEDSGTHMEDSEKLANIVNANNGAFLTNKIFFDAYKQEKSSGGDSYPDVTVAINNRVQNGVLILNYMGHANPRFLAVEHVLDISNINSWTNINKLPIFVTATCEFSRFDADETSAGETVLLNPNGGGIGLFSTTRVVFSGPNYELSKSFYDRVFFKNSSGDFYRMGDIMRMAKNGIANSTNKRCFALLADPALRLTYPKYNVVTTSINQGEIGEVPDTIGAMSKVTVTGYLADNAGQKLSNFSGRITPIVYDKAMTLKTLGNAGETPVEYTFQENVIYKGLASVENGEFSFSFIVPKDISYSLGKGKIIYYAENGADDANGYFDQFIIGGSDEQISDNQGPQVDLFIDDESFVSGGKTSKNPLLIVKLMDENGINTVGAGIGHDITAVLDGDDSQIIVLNDYYQANADDYTQGRIEYPLSGLSTGEHTLKVKVWDVANNSTEAEIKFLVTSDFYIESLSNFPNPVSEYTYFTFSHNQPDANFAGLIEIFDYSGRKIYSTDATITSSGYKSTPVRWDISDISFPISNGIYFYRITIKSSDGAITGKTAKMAILR